MLPISPAFPPRRNRRKQNSRLTFNNSVHGTTLLAEAAIDAFSHVYIVASCSTAAVLALLGFDRYGGGRADSLT